MQSIKTMILFVVLLSVIVVIHEFGHLIVAKFFGVYCQEFSVGMGPKLWSKKGKETEYCIRAIPFGGFVAMAGDSDNSLETSVDTSEIPVERTLPGVAPWKRIAIMLAGIFMNCILALLIMSLIFLHTGAYAVSPDATIAAVSPGSPAEKAGLLAGDRIVKAELENGTSASPKTFNELSIFLDTYDGTGKFYFEVDRNGEILHISVMPEYNEEYDRYLIGISSGQYKTVEVNLGNCVYYAFDYLAMMFSLIVSSLLGLLRGVGLNNLSGPVGVYSTTAQAVSLGAVYYFELMALISLNIGIFNALPLPILDGGRVLLTLIEMIIGHPISQKVQNIIMTISVAIVIGLFLLATTQDILRLF